MSRLLVFAKAGGGGGGRGGRSKRMRRMKRVCGWVERREGENYESTASFIYSAGRRARGEERGKARQGRT